MLGCRGAREQGCGGAREPCKGARVRRRKRGVINRQIVRSVGSCVRHSGEPWIGVQVEGEKTVVRSCVASGLVSVIPAQAGIQSNNGCIQILPILWMPPYQVRGRPC